MLLLHPVNIFHEFSKGIMVKDIELPPPAWHLRIVRMKIVGFVHAKFAETRVLLFYSIPVHSSAHSSVNNCE
jgi:hypothetical protein